MLFLGHLGAAEQAPDPYPTLLSLSICLHICWFVYLFINRLIQKTTDLIFWVFAIWCDVIDEVYFSFGCRVFVRLWITPLFSPPWFSYFTNTSSTTFRAGLVVGCMYFAYHCILWFFPSVTFVISDSTLGLLVCFLNWMWPGSVLDSLLSLSPASSPSPLSSVSTLLLLDPSFLSWRSSFLSPPPALCSNLIWRRRVGDSLPRNGLLSSGPDSILPRMALTTSLLLHSLRFGWTVLWTETVLIFPLSSEASPAITRGVTVSLTTCWCSFSSFPSTDSGIQPFGIASCLSECSLAQPCQLFAKLATMTAHFIFRTARLKVWGSCGETVVVPPLLIVTGLQMRPFSRNPCFTLLMFFPGLWKQILKRISCQLSSS